MAEPCHCSNQRAASIHTLSALLQMGFTRRTCLQMPGALLPHHFALTAYGRQPACGGMFLWHFPSGRPARPLAGIIALWSPDFPLDIV